MKKFLKILIVISVLSAIPLPAMAGALDPIIARILLIVIKNVEWSQRNITICTYGASRVGTILQESNFEGGGNARKFNVLDNITLKEINKCQMLYISPGKEGELSSIFKEIGSKHILTTSDIEDFTENNGMIGITIGRRNNIVLEFNEEVITSANIKIDPIFLLGHQSKK